MGMKSAAMAWRRVSRFVLLTLVLQCSSSVAQFENCTGTLAYIGDGGCDSSNNNPSCDYDGGDCCECTCVDTPEYTCGSYGYDCLDPECIDSVALASYPECTGQLSFWGDGICHEFNNNLDCGYDGGDCCICTCDGLCAMNVGDDCLDPSAGNELYGCEEQTSIIPPCSSEVQQSWVVDGSAQAQTLAEAVNCSGGTFDVEWEGDIAISKSIYVIDGTVLNVTGIGYEAGIDGGSDYRLFTVINASLHLTNLSLRSGSAIVGGAIAATESRLVLSNTSFVGNEAIGLGAVGGAMFVTNGSSVVFDGGSSIFSSNTAVSDGGALYVSGNSIVSFRSSRMYFLNNTAGDDGGALAVRTGSQLFGDGEAVFSENGCERFGGAIDIFGAVNAVWTGVTTFSNNTAGGGAGALMIRDISDVELFGDTTFNQNSAALLGGIVYIATGSRLVWSRETTFTGNYGATFGALIVTENSTASWSGKTTFVSNAADEYGGALVVTIGSTVSWNGTTTFTDNHGHYGGSVYVSGESSISWSGQTVFMSNVADSNGGALVITLGSNCSWSGLTSFLTNHADYGGALLVSHESFVSWSGNTTFAHNAAERFAGAFYIYNSCTWWSGPTEFLNNSIIDSNGSSGAFYSLYSNVGWSSFTVFSENRAPSSGAFNSLYSNISWSGETEFNSNRADGINVSSASGAINLIMTKLEWSGKTLFFNNSANEIAGALFIGQYSNVSWRGETSFIENHASSGGGAILVLGHCEVSWSGPTDFLNNSANLGGGIVITNHSSASWSGDTRFLSNTAQFGGSIWMAEDVVVHWTSQTEFVANHAEFEGGAIRSTTESVDELSALVIAGSTLFSNNTSGANGGALVLLSGISLKLETTEVIFFGNSAQVSGGAVYLSGADFGPTFEGVRFESNTAQIGGAVYATSSGNNKINVNGVETQNPTVFNGCTFLGNIAGATGGAIETAAGNEIFFNTSFVGNMAGVGGAMRLAGTALIERCSFEDNVSDEGGGPAVSNIGYISSMLASSFVDNAFACASGTYLDYNKSNDLYQVICDGCSTLCEECLFDRPSEVPVCTEAMDHSTSPGGLTMLEGLSIDPHYWRATNTSLNIFECHNLGACRGGLTQSVNYCREGYEGPYCAICSDGYTPSIGFSCEKCSGNVGGIVLAICLCAVGVIFVVAVLWYLGTSAAERTEHGLIQRIMRYIPLQSLKIIIVVWQILTQFASVANVTYPDVYQRFLDIVNVLNFDLAWVLSAGCIVDFNFHDRLLFSTIGPIVIAALLAATYTIALKRNRESESGLESVRHKHLSALLLLTFLVYSSVSSILFQTFACEHLDDGKYYLRADYRIECDTVKHEALQVYAGFMVVVYSLGIPVLYAALLFKDREVLRKDEAIRNEDSSVHTTSSLWKPYKPSVFYYEVIECGRRILLTGVVVFIYPNTAAQIAITLILAFTFAMISEGLHPYVSIWDTWISRVGHVIVFMSMYIALLLKVDVSGERAESQRTFEVILVSVHGCLIATVLAEAFVLAKSVTGNEEESTAPLRRKDAITWNKDSSLEEIDHTLNDSNPVVPSSMPRAGGHEV